MNKRNYKITYNKNGSQFLLKDFTSDKHDLGIPLQLLEFFFPRPMIVFTVTSASARDVLLSQQTLGNKMKI